MIQPVVRDEAFLSDVKQAESDESVFHLWWLGQSGFLLRWKEFHLLLDPYLSDSLTRKYAGTDKPHVRMTEIVVPPERLDFIDIILSSHNHTDHLDGETLVPLLRRNPKARLVIPEANRDFVADRLKIEPDFPLGVDDGRSISADGFEFSGIAAAHDTIERDESGRCRCLGYVVAFGRWRIYHSGDTRYYDALADRLRRFSIDVALLPINGSAPERRVPGNMNGREAARLAREIGARIAIPHHYEMFEFNTASPDDFVDEAQKTGQPYRLLRCGERWSSSELERD